MPSHPLSQSPKLKATVAAKSAAPSAMQSAPRPSHAAGASLDRAPGAKGLRSMPGQAVRYQKRASGRSVTHRPCCFAIAANLKHP